MGVGTAVCHESLAGPITEMMQGWQALERQKTPFHVVPLASGGEIEIKPDIALRGLEVAHTSPSMGYAIIEYRSKLRPELQGQPQERLRELRMQGEEITRRLEIPLIAFTGDTRRAPSLFRDEFARARVVISECTFFDPDRRDRAALGKHLHVDDIVQLLEVWEAETVILTHLSRRTHVPEVREILRQRLKESDLDRVHLLMDHRSNRLRYERQGGDVRRRDG